MENHERKATRWRTPMQGFTPSSTVVSLREADAKVDALEAEVDALYDRLRGTVERAERAEELAVRLYRLMGEEAERICPGEMESSELLRDRIRGR